MLTQVRTAFCDSCMEITVQSNGGAQEHQPNRFSTLLRTKNQVKLIRYPNKGEWGSAQQVPNSFENKKSSQLYQIKRNGDHPNRFTTFLRTNMSTTRTFLISEKENLAENQWFSFEGSARSEEMALFGRTWFPSGLQTTLSKISWKSCFQLQFYLIFLLSKGTSPLTQCQTLWSTTSSGSSQRPLEASTQVK